MTIQPQQDEPQAERAFYHYRSAWYGNPKHLQDGVLDIVTFGLSYPEGGVEHGELNMVWYEQGPRLEVFHDGWPLLTILGEALDAVAFWGEEAHGNQEQLTPQSFCSLLLALGFADRTSKTRDDPPPAPQPATVYYLAVRTSELAKWRGAGWYEGVVIGAVDATTARVTFRMPDGVVVDCNLKLLDLWNALPLNAVVANQPIEAGQVLYYLTSDYGWLKVWIGHIHEDIGQAFIFARNGDEVLIAGESVHLSDLERSLPDGAACLNTDELYQDAKARHDQKKGVKTHAM